MHCEGSRQQEVDWDALWAQRKREIAKRYREEHRKQIKERESERREIRKEQRRAERQKFKEEHEEEYRQYRNAIVRKSQMRRRAEARANGLCIQCCKGVPTPGRKSCPKCLERARDYARRKREVSPI